MRKMVLIAAAILFLTMGMSFAFAQTPTPTAGPNSSPSPTPESPVKKETPKQVVVTKDGTEWFVTKDLLPVYTIPKLCPIMAGDQLIFLSCEFPKLPVKPKPPVKVDPQNPPNSRPSIGEATEQITPTPTPTPLAERVVEVVNAWEKDDIVGKSPVPSKKHNWSWEVSSETAINNSYDDLTVTDRFYQGWVANQFLDGKVTYKDKVYCGGYVWIQTPTFNFKPSYGREVDFGGYCGAELPKGFTIEAGVSKFNVQDGSINNYAFSISKEFELNYGYTLEVKNETNVFTTKIPGLRGGIANGTSYTFSKKFVNDVVTPSLKFAHIFDDNPYYDKQFNLRGLVTGEIDFAISDHSSVFIGGGAYFGIIKNTIRQNHLLFTLGFRWSKGGEF